MRSARPEVEICRTFGLSNASFNRNRHQIAAEVSLSVRKSDLGIEAAVTISTGSSEVAAGARAVKIWLRRINIRKALIRQVN